MWRNGLCCKQSQEVVSILTYNQRTILKEMCYLEAEQVIKIYSLSDNIKACIDSTICKVLLEEKCKITYH